jgi:hypothetical protein
VNVDEEDEGGQDIVVVVVVVVVMMGLGLWWIERAGMGVSPESLERWLFGWSLVREAVTVVLCGAL